MMAATESNNQKPLGELIEVSDQTLAAIQVSGVELDSRQVSAGDMFLACAGFAVDGRDYIDQAIAAGAVAVLAEQNDQWANYSERNGVPVLVVENLSQKISGIAGQFFDHPSKQLPVLAVTGTNGKTSCTQLLMQLLNAMNKSCAVIGTLGTGADGAMEAGINTTPSAVAIQKLLATWLAQGISTVAMEVSSHGLEQGRVQALQFELALFTNLSRDHLDYHGSMQAYAEAKARLFKQPGLKRAVINIDDSFSETLLNIIADDVEVIRYSVDAAKDAAKRIDVWVENISYHPDGVSAQFHSPWGEFELHSPLLGDFNLSNVVAAVSGLGAQGYPVATVIESLKALGTIAGRMEKISATADINVVVDYAHTPDALEKALVAIRQHSDGDVWCVFGCGGDRDQGKRPQMGEMVQRYADHIVVTSDNPRHEQASDIINEILGGIDCPSLVEEDRAIAIEFAISNAKAGDCVLIAGKGHEDYQQVGDLRIPFSDIKQARLALAERAGVAE
ncbi:MAG: UDP-N-acetylmuramoyl-L-alanyl-D-glutamate--2,6-diaminopimelate ligase [Oceanicoccus sp.]|uniref:UDP-N-acetylmuramoyl-L-alanyl-D-glutamate--2, 6-diaminopimelate ligase n=1 Tax=Oceanicoccus sp. TaxID=2691044 RepID=UPI0026249BEC|nr:UDP-N-acetylmuramoyl-L-alanyl-D-glutamate--2,6-diaminopimelate ligase [Oceanicoccus sp.]MDG1773178.1 UDP-N-acetylmuramoyl-L-alanyl-D-glutamate--2,6-diaminopimelate ligase [Oceanicoccus sp.]